MKDSLTISMEGSEKYSWDDVRDRVKELGLNTISRYIQKLVEKDIDNRKYENALTYAIMLMGFSIVILLILFR